MLKNIANLFEAQRAKEYLRNNIHQFYTFPIHVMETINVVDTYETPIEIRGVIEPTGEITDIEEVVVSIPSLINTARKFDQIVPEFIEREINKLNKALAVRNIKEYSFVQPRKPYVGVWEVGANR